MSRENTMSSALDFLKRALESKENRVKFTKKDGSEREMRFTLNFDIIPKKDRPKGMKLPRIISEIQDDGLLRVYDLDKEGWRSIVFESVSWLQTKNMDSGEIQIFRKQGR